MSEDKQEPKAKPSKARGKRPARAKQPMFGKASKNKSSAKKPTRPKTPSQSPAVKPSSDKWQARCLRSLQALRETRRRLREAELEAHALREELLAAGELIDDLTSEIEKLSSSSS